MDGALSELSRADGWDREGPRYGKEREVEALRASNCLIACKLVENLRVPFSLRDAMAQGKSRAEHVKDCCRLLRGREIEFLKKTSWVSIHDGKERMKY